MERVIEKIDQIISSHNPLAESILGNGEVPKKEDFIYIEPRNSQKEFVFIDGGNNEIMGSSNFSIQLIKTSSIFISNNERTRMEQNVCYAIIESRSEEKKHFFEVSILPIKGIFEESRFDIKLYENIAENNRMMPISNIADIVRRMCEIYTANAILSKLEQGSAIMFDGSLSTSHNEEQKVMNELIRRSKEKGILALALSKTVRMIDGNGNNILPKIKKASPGGRWYCRINTRKDNPFLSFLVMLNERSEYIFRIDMPCGDDTVDVSKVMGILASNSTDPLFLGYPYALVLADRFARVSDQERDIFKAKLNTKLGSRLDHLKPLINSINAHDRLDSINHVRE